MAGVAGNDDGGSNLAGHGRLLWVAAVEGYEGEDNAPNPGVAVGEARGFCWGEHGAAGMLGDGLRCHRGSPWLVLGLLRCFATGGELALAALPFGVGLPLAGCALRLLLGLTTLSALRLLVRVGDLNRRRGNGGLPTPVELAFHQRWVEGVGLLGEDGSAVGRGLEVVSHREGEHQTALADGGALLDRSQACAELLERRVLGVLPEGLNHFAERGVGRDRREVEQGVARCSTEERLGRPLLACGLGQSSNGRLGLAGTSEVHRVDDGEDGHDHLRLSHLERSAELGLVAVVGGVVVAVVVHGHHPPTQATRTKAEVSLRLGGMRVLYVLASGGRGGMQVQTNDLAVAMLERGHEVMVASGPPGLELDPHLPFTALPNFERRLLGGPKFIRALRKVVREFKPDAIQGRGLRLAPALRLARRGRAATVTYAGMPAKDRRVAALVTRWSGVPATSVGRSPREELLAYGLESEVLPLIVAPPAEPYDRDELLRGLGLDPARPVALFAGRLVPQKDPLSIPAVMAAAPSWSLIIAGRGPLGDQLEAGLTARGLGDRVALVGWRDDVPRLMATAEAFLSTAAWEGYGGSVLEAHAAATPIVAFAAPGVREVVEEGRSGLLAPLGDASALGACLERLAEEPGLAARLAEAGPEIAAECLPDASVAANVAFYEAMARSSRKR